MNKALVVTMGAVGRRFAIMAGTGLLAYAVDQWTHWLRSALEGNPTSAAWVPAVWLLIEFAQKFVRELPKQGGAQ